MARVDEATVGARFERLVVRQVYRKQIPCGRRGLRWFYFATCDCDCGKARDIRVERLGKTGSCGCLRSEHITTHAVTKTHRRIYTVWYLMVRRCTNPKDQQYRNYGARGIGVCPEWASDPAAFRDWAVANGYEPHLTLDRRENNEGYSPENCRWVTMKAQLNNTRKNVLIPYEGGTLTLSQQAERVGIHKGTIGSRLRNGWSVERALSEPVQHRGRRQWKATKQLALFRNVRKAAEELLQAMDGDWVLESADRIAALRVAVEQSKCVAP